MQLISLAHGFSLEATLSERNPFAAFAGKNMAANVQTEWANMPALPNSVPDVAHTLDILIKRTLRDKSVINSASTWVGIARDNNALQDTVYKPTPYQEPWFGGYYEKIGTFVLPTGSRIEGVTLLMGVQHDVDDDPRYRGLLPSVCDALTLAHGDLPHGELADKSAAACAALYAATRNHCGWRPQLQLLVSYTAPSHRDQAITLPLFAPEKGSFDPQTTTPIEKLGTVDK